MTADNANSYYICIASRQESDWVDLKGRLSPLKKDLGKIDFLGMPLENLSQRNIELSLPKRPLVYLVNLPENLSRDVMTVRELLLMKRKSPMVILTHTDTMAAVRQLPAVDRLVILEYPIEDSVLQNIVRRLFNEELVLLRRHRRFATKQNVVITADEKKLDAMIANLSKGGAFIEFSQKMDGLARNQKVSLLLDLDDVKESHTMPAKIVWVAELDATGRTGIGVEFIK